MGERKVAKRIGVVLSLMRHPLVVSVAAPLVILSEAKDLVAALLAVAHSYLPTRVILSEAKDLIAALFAVT